MKIKESSYYIWFALVFISTVTGILGYLEITKDDISNKAEIIAKSLQDQKTIPIDQILNPKEEEF